MRVSRLVKLRAAELTTWRYVATESLDLLKEYCRCAPLLSYSSAPSTSD